MTHTAGIDIGSTYTKVIILSEDDEIVGKAIAPTGFKLTEIAEKVYRLALGNAKFKTDDVNYIISTGFGRHQASISDTAVTDLTSNARGANFFFPNTRTVLDIGGQTMKASRLDEKAKVKSFRLNDKCAAGTGAFLEKTARYMGYDTVEIGPLVATANNKIPISGVCAVFAESEVINQLSEGPAPSDIMYGSMESLIGRSVQLMKRVRAEPEFTMAGGILRFTTMIGVIAEQLGAEINIPGDDLVQFTSAVGAAVLGHVRLRKLRVEGGWAGSATDICCVTPGAIEKKLNGSKSLV